MSVFIETDQEITNQKARIYLQYNLLLSTLPYNKQQISLLYIKSETKSI